MCDEIVELGVPNGTIHKPNEEVAVVDLERLVHMYVGILERMVRNK